MKNKEVIKLLKDTKMLGLVFETYRDETPKAVTQAIHEAFTNIIKALTLLKDELDDWIPVSKDTMPENKQACFWLIRNCLSEIEACVFIYFTKKEAEFIRDFSHWMPIVLPKPKCSKCGGSGWVETDEKNEITMSGAEMERLGIEPLYPKYCPCGCKPQETKPTEWDGECSRIPNKDLGEPKPDEFDIEEADVIVDLSGGKIYIQKLKDRIEQLGEVLLYWMARDEARQALSVQLEADAEKKDKLLFAYESVAMPINPLIAENKQQAEQIAHLHKYANHRRSCNIYRPLHNACDCGLMKEAEDDNQSSR